MRKKVVALLLLLGVAMPVVRGAIAGATPAERFLAFTRERAALQNSFADLRGKVSHIKRNQGRPMEYPICFVVRFSKEKVQGKLAVGDGENHFFSRENTPDGSVATKSNRSGKTLLSELGFRIGDLAMDFLNFKFHSELAEARHKSSPCRVLLMRSPEGKPVKVWIAKEYFFPLKAEFYNSIQDINGKPERSLEITGFEKVNNYYVATDIALLTREFRSRIKFVNIQACSADDPRAKAEFK